MPGIVRPIVLLSCFILAVSATATPLAQFDPEGWSPTHHVGPLRTADDGLTIPIAGPDPYIHSPRFDVPEGQELWLEVRLKSETAGEFQVFYFQDHPREEHSVRRTVAGGVWTDLKIPLPPLGKGYRLRIDPPGTKGIVVISSVVLSARKTLSEPAWEKPTNPDAPDALVLKSDDLALRHSRTEWGGFTVTLAGKPVAAGFNRPLIGYVQEDRQRWIKTWENARVFANEQGETVRVTSTFLDDDGATWTLSHRFSKGSNATIDVEAEVVVDRDRSVIFLPLLLLTPGAGSFGQNKTQALFPGLEYLDRDEPSSSELDVLGPGSMRQVPDTLKVTMPMSVVLADDAYVGLIWQPHPDLAPVFDSPDRLFHSGGHVTGLIFPGSTGDNRAEGSLLPHYPTTLKANMPVKARATIVAGKAQSVVPAIQQYVALRGLPDVPREGVGDLRSFVKLASAGWLDSGAKVGNRYRHALPGAFGANAAADAAVFMDWLGIRSDDKDLATKLKDAAKGALSEVPAGQYAHSGVSHVRPPVGVLLYGHVDENVESAKRHGHALLSRFEPDGALLYRPGKVDYGKTHFAKDANGLTATTVAAVLEAATVSGDPELIAEGLRMLRAMDKFKNSAPRGAQTWEVPLHTPDILASAYLVKSYTLGYELTGDESLLDTARHWAWTGLPFVYLVNPTNNATGPYATIAVYGATSWVAPNWMGLPVQWCGLVYADALYRLSKYDAKTAPWAKVADGIVASGIQQTFPVGSDPERQGLLPDSFSLRTGVRHDPAINPGTLQAPAIRFFTGAGVYDFHAFHEAGVFVHAPGRLAAVPDEPGEAVFRVEGWPAGPYRLLLSGIRRPVEVWVNGGRVPTEGGDTPEKTWTSFVATGACEVRVRTR